MLPGAGVPFRWADRLMSTPRTLVVTVRPSLEAPFRRRQGSIRRLNGQLDIDVVDTRDDMMWLYACLDEEAIIRRNPG